MNALSRNIIAGLALGTFAGLCGCEFDEPHAVIRGGVVYDDGPVVEGPVEYDYTYYDAGYYNGPYWYYRDRDGHWYHELREIHERRALDRRADHFRETRPPAGVERRSGGMTHRDSGHQGAVRGGERDSDRR